MKVGSFKPNFTGYIKCEKRWDYYGIREDLIKQGAEEIREDNDTFIVGYNHLPREKRVNAERAAIELLKAEHLNFKYAGDCATEEEADSLCVECSKDIPEDQFDD